MKKTTKVGMQKITKVAMEREKLAREIGLLKRENAHLRSHSADLSAQNLTLSHSPVITPEMTAEITRLRQEHEEARQQINKIALWLRVNKEKEIAMGQHAGKDLADVVIGYMAEGPKERITKPQLICDGCKYCQQHCECGPNGTPSPCDIRFGECPKCETRRAQ